MTEKKFIWLNTILLLVGLCFQSPIFAQEKESIEDRIIGSTFKTLAKAYVAIADINKLQKSNIDKLNNMDEEKFERRYVKVYEVIKDLPSSLRTRHKVTGHMTKQEAVQNIQSLNKKKICEIIDFVPDTIIANHFKQYLKKKKQEIQKSNIVAQVQDFWNKIIKKSEGK